MAKEKITKNYILVKDNSNFDFQGGYPLVIKINNILYHADWVDSYLPEEGVVVGSRILKREEAYIGL